MFSVRAALHESTLKSVYDNTLRRYLAGQYEEALDNLMNLPEKLEKEAMRLSGELENLIEEIIEWIRARDPVSFFYYSKEW